MSVEQIQREVIRLPAAEQRKLAAWMLINGSSVYWPELDADIGVEGLLAGAREHSFYARHAVQRAVQQGRLPATALDSPPEVAAPPR